MPIVAITAEAVHAVAIEGKAAEIEAALATFPRDVRLRDPRAIALRASRQILAGDVAGGVALLKRAFAHSAGADRQYLLDLLVPPLISTNDERGAMEALDTADESVPELIPAFASLRAIMYARQGEDQRSRALAMEALELGRTLDRPLLLGRILLRVGFAAFHRQDFDEAQQRAVEAARAYETSGAYRQAAGAYSLLYIIAHDWIGDPDLSRLYAERMTMSAERGEDASIQVAGLVAQLEIAAQAGDYKRLGSLRARLFASTHAEQYRERLAYLISEVLLNGWARRFEPARALLVSARGAAGRSLPELALCDALLALMDAARWDVDAAKRRAHRVIGQTAHHAEPEALHEAAVRRIARILAACTCILVGESSRGRRALSRQFDPDDVFGRLVHGSLDEQAVPPMLRGYARLVNVVRDVATGHAPVAGLTQAELDVLRALPDGGSLDQIARSFGKSRNTIAGHVKGIYDKLSVSSRTQAVQRARELGIYS